MPMDRQIQPIGFSGRLDAIRAPTTGKARKGSREINSPLSPPAPQELGTSTDLAGMYNAIVAANRATERPNNMGGTDNRMLTADKMMVSQTLHLLSAHSP